MIIMASITNDNESVMAYHGENNGVAVKAAIYGEKRGNQQRRRWHGVMAAACHGVKRPAREIVAEKSMAKRAAWLKAAAKKKS